jgi:hypothetical protein
MTRNEKPVRRCNPVPATPDPHHKSPYAANGGTEAWDNF